MTPPGYRPDNLLGNVLGVIADRMPLVHVESGEPVNLSGDEIANLFAAEYGDGDFDAGESRFWDAHGGPLCDEIMRDLGLDWG